MIGRLLGEEAFSVFNKVGRLELSEMVKFEHLKVIRELDMQISGGRTFCAKALSQECSGML